MENTHNYYWITTILIIIITQYITIYYTCLYIYNYKWPYSNYCNNRHNIIILRPEPLDTTILGRWGRGDRWWRTRLASPNISHTIRCPQQLQRYIDLTTSTGNTIQRRNPVYISAQQTKKLCDYDTSCKQYGGRRQTAHGDGCKQRQY